MIFMDSGDRGYRLWKAILGYYNQIVHKKGKYSIAAFARDSGLNQGYLNKLMSGKMRSPSDYKLKGIASAAAIHLAPDQARIMTEQTRKLRYLIECRNYDLELDERDNRKTELPPPLDPNDDPEPQG